MTIIRIKMNKKSFTKLNKVQGLRMIELLKKWRRRHPLQTDKIQ